MLQISDYYPFCQDKQAQEDRCNKSVKLEGLMLCEKFAYSMTLNHNNLEDNWTDRLNPCWTLNTKHLKVSRALTVSYICMI